MAGDDRKINIIIQARVAATSALENLASQLLSIKNIAIAGAAALTAYGLAVAEVTRRAIKQENADVRLAVALASVGDNSEEARNKLGALAAEIQDATAISDEAVQEAMGTLIQLGRVGTDNIERVIRATVELAAVTGRDLASAADLMAKAAQGNTVALSRYGIVLDESIPKNERFAALLQLIEKNMGGTAETMGKTLGSAFQRILNDFDDLLQAVGKSVIESETLRDILGGVAGSLKEAAFWVEHNRETIDAWVRSTIEAILTLSQLGVSTLNVAAALAEIDLKVRSFTGRLTGSSSYGEAVASLDRAIIELALTTGPAFSRTLDEMRARLDASAPPVKTLSDLLVKSHASIDDLIIVMHRQGETAVNVAGQIKNFAGAITVTVSEATKLDEVLKNLSLETMAEMQARTSGVDDAVQRLVAALESGAISPEQFDAILESLIGITEQTQGWTTDLNAAAGATSNLASLVVELQQTAEEAATQGALQLGDAFVDAAFGAKVSWGQAIREILAGIAKAIAKALILKAIQIGLSFIGGGAGAAAGAAVTTVVAQHGGEVRGGRFGLDSVAAFLTPGEIVLPRSRAEDFDAVADLAREVRGRRTPAGISERSTERPINLSLAVLAGDRFVGELVDHINRFVERRGGRLISSEVLP